MHDALVKNINSPGPKFKSVYSHLRYFKLDKF